MNLMQQYQNLSQSDYLSGRVVVNRDECSGCKNCVAVCPADALEMQEKKSQMIAGSECISCGACVAVCDTNSIRIANFWKIPTGAYQTLGRRQSTGREAYPRMFN